MRPFAVITTASSGMGLELAHQFALGGHDILIASANEEILNAQDELEVYGTDVECIEVDLGTFNGVELLTKAIRTYNRPIDVLVINAGIEMGGVFTETKLKDEITMINLNTISAVHLTKNLLPDMYQQGAGQILFASSVSNEVPQQNETVYAATKAFIKSFADGLKQEAKEHGIEVTFLDGKSSFKTKIQDWANKVLPEKFKVSYHHLLNTNTKASHGTQSETHSRHS